MLNFAPRLNGQNCEVGRMAITNPVLAEPRYVSLPGIMKAKKKPIEKLSPSDLSVDLTPRIETVKVSEPPKRVGGGKVFVYIFLCRMCILIAFS